SWCAGLSSTTSSPISISAPAARTKSSRASGRGAAWRPPWCSGRSTSCGSSSARPVAQPSSTTSPRRSSACSIGSSTSRRQSSCRISPAASGRSRSNAARATSGSRPRSSTAGTKCGSRPWKAACTASSACRADGAAAPTRAGKALRKADERRRISLGEPGEAMKARRAALGKTTRPRVAGVLARRRLFGLLEKARDGAVVWISGPPGCGKTTLAASYLDHCGIAALWYQLDEGDADPATFFYYLRLAVEDLQRSAQSLPLLAPEYHAALTTFARRYFQSLYALLEPPFAVVFDGYHE